jgi:PIN domain nuclease of toxin-antitoxin system
VNAAPVLDTRAWIWWMLREGRLGATTLAQLDAYPISDRPAISGISLWEVAILTERGRLDVGLPLRDWLALAAHPRTVRVVPISPAIAAETTTLPRSLRDPADRIIVATSRVLGMPLLTCDAAILRARVADRWVVG